MPQAEPNASAQAPFKEWINREAVATLANAIAAAHPAFDAVVFERAVSAKLDDLELKDRVRHVARVLHEHLPPKFPAAVDVLRRATAQPGYGGMISWSLCQFVEDRGLAHFEQSMQALHEFTPLFSAEFAIRPFLLQMPRRTLKQLAEWTGDTNEHVRRLVSEGTRTRLPWGQQLPHFIADPDPVFELLERLRDDPELYVRRSVANNLNDLSKDHPERVVETVRRWKEAGGERQAWIAGHALRTLVKRGDPAALAVLGYGPAEVRLVSLEASPAVKLGESLHFTTELVSTGRESQRLMIDFAIHHVKKNGSRTPKVFKWSKRELAPGATIRLTKRHAIKPITTRRYYAGTHALEVFVNGTSLGQREFELAL